MNPASGAVKLGDFGAAFLYDPATEDYEAVEVRATLPPHRPQLYPSTALIIALETSPMLLVLAGIPVRRFSCAPHGLASAL